jgi:sulfite reductase beta subunit-like hemoprotein
METKIVHTREDNNSATGEYREAVKRLIETEVGNIIDEEIRKAARELVEEQRKAIREAVEEHKLVIRQVVEEEKKAIWSRLEELRRSIIRLGMG